MAQVARAVGRSGPGPIRISPEVGPGYVLRALVAIDLLAQNAMSADELAAALGVHRRTANRLIDVMTEAGWVEADDEASRSVRLTTRVLTVAGEVMRRTDLIRAGGPIVRRLRDRVDESSHLSVVSDGAAVNILEEPSRHPLAVTQVVGNRVPLHCSAVGKAITAFRPEFADLLRSGDLARFTPNTLTSAEALDREFERIRRDGYAMDDAELYPDTRCVAAPVRDAFGRVVASIGTSGPAVRLTRDRAEVIARIVVDEAAAVSHVLGFTGDGEPGPDGTG